MESKTPLHIAVFVGSLRKKSYNLKIAKALKALAPASLSLEIIDLSDIPMYNEDLEADVPPQWKNLREQISAANALLFLTPEYNRSVPAVLKNAIDVGSRPKKDNSWNAKPGAVISVSPGQLSAFGANHHLRQVLVPLNVPVMPTPEVYIGGVASLLDEQGNLTSDSTREFLLDFLRHFEKWVQNNS